MSEPFPFERQACSYILAHRLIAPGDIVFAGVSGGPDSTALLHVLVALREALQIRKIVVLHFDHQLRGEASEADRAFVEALAHRLGLSFQAGTEDVRGYGTQHRISLEMAARACRHRFFREASACFERARLALGHTAADQAEELLLRLLRGVGPSGGGGMPPGTPQGTIRPLLFATRPQIMEYLCRIEEPFQDDASNLDPFCQRNVLRLKIFPILSEHFHDRIVEVLARHAELVREEESYWEAEIRGRLSSLLVQEGPDRVALDLSEIEKLHPALQKRFLRFAIERLRGHLLGIYTVHIDSILSWLPGSKSGKRLHLPGGLKVWRHRQRLVFLDDSSLEPRSDILGPDIEIHGPGTYVFTGLGLTLTLFPASPESFHKAALPSPRIVWMDTDQLRWPLFIRHWQPGDRFRPLGMGGSKKLQDYFTDIGVPSWKRRRIPLLCDQEKICWVVGYRMDDRVKLGWGTRTAVRIQTDPPSPEPYTD